MTSGYKILAALLVSSTAIPAYAATEFNLANYSIALEGGSLGLSTQQVTTTKNFTLNQGQNTGYFNLFKIWTNDNSVDNSGDQVHRDITLNFNFDAPDYDFGGVANGGTFGVQASLWTLGTEFVKLEWANGGQFDFAFGNGGVLRLFLTDEVFNKGFLDLSEGKKHGAMVEAKFKLIEPSSAIPEPATWLTMVAGFGMVGAAMRRRKTLVAA